MHEGVLSGSLWRIGYTLHPHIQPNDSHLLQNVLRKGRFNKTALDCHFFWRNKSAEDSFGFPTRAKASRGRVVVRKHFWKHVGFARKEKKHHNPHWLSPRQSDSLLTLVLPVWDERHDCSEQCVSQDEANVCPRKGGENMRTGAPDLLEITRSGENRPVAEAYTLMAPTGKCGPILWGIINTREAGWDWVPHLVGLSGPAQAHVSNHELSAFFTQRKINLVNVSQAGLH